MYSSKEFASKSDLLRIDNHHFAIFAVFIVAEQKIIKFLVPVYGSVLREGIGNFQISFQRFLSDVAPAAASDAI